MLLTFTTTVSERKGDHQDNHPRKKQKAPTENQSVNTVGRDFYFIFWVHAAAAAARAHCE